jgi:hypothetical protein
MIPMAIVCIIIFLSIPCFFHLYHQTVVSLKHDGETIGVVANDDDGLITGCMCLLFVKLHTLSYFTKTHTCCSKIVDIPIQTIESGDCCRHCSLGTDRLSVAGVEQRSKCRRTLDNSRSQQARC